MMKRNFLTFLGAAVLSLAGMDNARAYAVIGTTRVIYPAQQASVGVQLHNPASLPSLIQTWVDGSDETQTQTPLSAPFLVTPPLVRVEPHTTQTLRILHTGEALPEDRESLFYFNVVDVPPLPEREDGQSAASHIQVSVHSRLKLFYRPSSLPVPDATQYARVGWTRIEENGKPTLRVENPTPYHISFDTIKLDEDTALEGLDMLAPFESRTIPLPTAPLAAWHEVVWQVIDDYGGMQSGRSPLR